MALITLFLSKTKWIVGGGLINVSVESNASGRDVEDDGSSKTVDADAFDVVETLLALDEGILKRKQAECRTEEAGVGG